MRRVPSGRRWPSVVVNKRESLRSFLRWPYAASRRLGQEDHGIGEGGGHRVMRDHKHRLSQRVHGVAQHLHYLAADAGVQRPGRLVGEYRLRARDQGSGDGYALLLAAGELTSARSSDLLGNR